VYDRGDKQALAKHEVTAIWYTSVAPTDRLAARLRFDPDNGFHTQHRYLLRIVQLQGKHEVVLAEGDVRLE
jgi:hypothetical protein